MAEKDKPRCLNHKCNAILEKELNGSRVPEEEVEEESNLYETPSTSKKQSSTSKGKRQRVYESDSD